MFKRLRAPAATVQVVLNGTPIAALAGETVAAVLLVAGTDPYRTTAVSERPRAPYCMMGVCHDCLVEIDGVANRRGCRVRVAEGMRIVSQAGAPEPQP